MRTIFLLSCCLSLHLTSAHSQALPLPQTARPAVVLLDSGQTVRRVLVGLDTATYRAVRLKVERTDLLEYSRTLNLMQVAHLQTELRRTRAQLVSSGKDFDALANINKQLAALPLAKPLLFDPHTYIGVGAGVVLITALKLFLLH